MKQAGGIICQWVGDSGLVVMAGNVTVDPLVNGKKAEEVSGRSVSGTAAFALPE